MYAGNQLVKSIVTWICKVPVVVGADKDDFIGQSKFLVYEYDIINMRTTVINNSTNS